jgi:hypothetical protein
MSVTFVVNDISNVIFRNNFYVSNRKLFPRKSTEFSLMTLDIHIDSFELL